MIAAAITTIISIVDKLLDKTPSYSQTKREQWYLLQRLYNEEVKKNISRARRRSCNELTRADNYIRQRLREGYSMKIFMAMFLTLSACAMGPKSPEIMERKDQDKLWRPCQSFETKDASPVGKLCNRVCLNRKGSKCELWKQNIMDFSKESDFEFFRSGSFIFIDEDNL